MTTREQQRAEVVARLVGSVDSGLREEYKARAHAFAILVRTNGLTRTISYLDAKGHADGNVGQAYRRFADHVADALASMNAWNPGAGSRSPAALVKHIASDATDLVAYMALTRETLALAEWFKRFSISLNSPEAARIEG